MERWVGKVAVVTGASSGIGEAIVNSLTTAGMKVVGLARRENRLAQLSKTLKNSNGSFDYVKCDVTKEEDILEALTFVEKKFGGIDVMVNNAGIAKKESISEGDTKTFQSVLNVNVLGPAICTREAMKSLRKRKTEGHIFYINSVLGLNAATQNTDTNLYAASKFGLRAMSETIKREILKNKDNIKVTSIYPGLVKTEIVRHSGLGDEIFDLLPHLQSKEIADCLVFALATSPGTQVGQIVISALHENL